MAAELLLQLLGAVRWRPIVLCKALVFLVLHQVSIVYWITTCHQCTAFCMLIAVGVPGGYSLLVLHGGGCI